MGSISQPSVEREGAAEADRLHFQPDAAVDGHELRERRRLPEVAAVVPFGEAALVGPPRILDLANLLSKRHGVGAPSVHTHVLDARPDMSVALRPPAEDRILNCTRTTPVSSDSTVAALTGR